MKKTEFLEAVAIEAADVSALERNHMLEYYAEIIDEAVEEGQNEEDVIARLGSWEEIREQIAAYRTTDVEQQENMGADEDKSAQFSVRQKWKSLNLSLPTWAVVLLILTSPVWGSLLFSLLVSVFAVTVSLLGIGGSVVVALFAVTVSFGAVGIVGIPASVLLFFTGGPAQFLLLLGMALCCIGLAIFGWMVSHAAAKGFVSFVKLLFGTVRGCFR